MPMKAPPVPYYNWILISNNQIIAQAVATHLDYAEYDDGRTGVGVVLPPGTFVDGEKGWAYGAGLKGSVMTNWIVDNFYFMAEGSYQKGTLSYMQGPALGVVFQNHNAEFDDFDLRVGKGFAVSPNAMITPFAEYGYHRWVRSVNNGETYQHQYAGAGVMVQVAPVERLVWSVSGMVGSTFDAQLDVAAIPAAGIVGITGLGLGSDLIWKVGTGLDFAITPAWHVSGEATYTEFKYGASATVPQLGPGYEPNSTSKVWTVKLGVGYSWGAPGPVVAKS